MSKKIAKLTILFPKADSLTHEEFHTYWRDSHAKLAVSIQIVKDNVIKYAQFHINNELSETLKASGVPMAKYDGCVEFWGESVEDLLAIFQDEEYLRVLVPDEARFLKREEAKMLIGWEDVIIEDGKVVEEKI